MIVDDRNFVDLIKDAWGAYNYEDGAGWDWVSRLADALEEAVERIAELEAERDAAVATLERVHEAVEKHKHWNDGCGWDVPTIEVLSALDGAPEPEWEYGVMWPDACTGEPSVWGNVETHIRSRLLPGMVMVRRRKAGPWLPVEGESNGV